MQLWPGIMHAVVSPTSQRGLSFIAEQVLWHVIDVGYVWPVKLAVVAQQI